MGPSDNQGDVGGASDENWRGGAAESGLRVTGIAGEARCRNSVRGARGVGNGSSDSQAQTNGEAGCPVQARPGWDAVGRAADGPQQRVVEAAATHDDVAVLGVAHGHAPLTSAAPPRARPEHAPVSVADDAGREGLRPAGSPLASRLVARPLLHVGHAPPLTVGVHVVEGPRRAQRLQDQVIAVPARRRNAEGILGVPAQVQVRRHVRPGEAVVIGPVSDDR